MKTKSNPDLEREYQPYNVLTTQVGVKTESCYQVEDYARIYGFRSSPSIGSQQQDNSLVLQSQSQMSKYTGASLNHNQRVQLCLQSQSLSWKRSPNVHRLHHQLESTFAFTLKTSKQVCEYRKLLSS